VSALFRLKQRFFPLNPLSVTPTDAASFFRSSPRPQLCHKLWHNCRHAVTTISPPLAYSSSELRDHLLQIFRSWNFLANGSW
jgi:hypothetical protein